MKTLSRCLAIVIVLLLPCIVFADSEGSTPAVGSPLNIILSILPLLIISVFIWFFLIKPMGSVRKKDQDYAASLQKHNAKMEQLLERIATALEKNQRN